MPPSRVKSTPPAEGRRERLTLAKLASYDDVATDALIDRVRVPSPARDGQLLTAGFSGLLLDQDSQEQDQVCCCQRHS